MQIFRSFVLGLELSIGATALLGPSNIQFTSSNDCQQIGATTAPPTIYLDSNDWPGAIRAARDVVNDFGLVLGRNGSVLLTNSTLRLPTSNIIIAGTIGKSRLIDTLVALRGLDVSGVKGKWESYVTKTLTNPFPGIQSAIVIAGSDKRGTIYGLYDLSEQIGVSPWYWWADVPVVPRDHICFKRGTKVQGPPSVKYRGIFLNDEAPALSNWVAQFYGKTSSGSAAFNTQFHAKLFELLLRLKANYLWPAMWNNMFYVDDAQNGPLAEYYGIVMGTSHTEPMARATKEQGQPQFLTGEWDWVSNNANVKKFMQEGAERSKNWETLYTLGMRGEHDTGSPSLNSERIQEIIDFQKSTLASTISSTPVTKIPKVWCLYKEVAGYYQNGLTVPDDVTLLWTDDNVGNVLRLPLANETSRSGGAGVYYHFDYVGAPRNYKWINTIQLSKTWEQMFQSYQRNAKQIWIVNVGDLKGLEIPINHFLDMAYDITKHSTPDSSDKWLNSWALREFGTRVPNFAASTASVLATYGKLIIRRKYEQLSTKTFVLSTINYDEAETVLGEWEELLDSAQALYDSLDAATRTPFFEMVLHPILAGKTVQEIYIKAALNTLYAGQRRTSTNVLANEVISAFAADQSITARYHGLQNGKWNHMMDQVHIGYTTWSDPPENSLPNLTWVSNDSIPSTGIMGVSVQGSSRGNPGDSPLPVTPVNPYQAKSDIRYVEVYTRANGTFDWNITSSASYVTLDPKSGTLSSPGTSDARAKIQVDWSAAPSGVSNVTLTVSRIGGTSVKLTLPVNKISAPPGYKGFVESNGAIAIESEHFATKSANGDVGFVTIPNYGRTLSGLTLLPVTAASQTTSSGPKLTYKFHTFSSKSDAKIIFYLGPSVNFDPTKPLKYAFALDDTAAKTVQPVPSTLLGVFPSGWTDAVNRNTWQSTQTISIDAGSHELSFWALEPGVVLQRIVIDVGGLKTSYLGPPESVQL